MGIEVTEIEHDLWWERCDLNTRPIGHEPMALPLRYAPILLVPIIRFERMTTRFEGEDSFR